MKTVLELIEYFKIPQEAVLDRVNKPNIDIVLMRLEKGNVLEAERLFELYQAKGILYSTKAELRNRKTHITRQKHNAKYGKNWFRKRKKYIDKLKIKQDNRCAMCGQEFSNQVVAEIDHITRVADGGAHDITNMQLLCRKCHDEKDNYKKGTLADGIHDVQTPVSNTV